jgi:hypothetical protein
MAHLEDHLWSADHSFRNAGLEDVESSTSQNPMGLHGLLQGYFTLHMKRESVRRALQKKVKRSGKK